MVKIIQIFRIFSLTIVLLLQKFSYTKLKYNWRYNPFKKVCFGTHGYCCFTSGETKVLSFVEYLWEYKRLIDATLWDFQSTFHCWIPKRALKNIEGNLTFLNCESSPFFQAQRIPQIFQFFAFFDYSFVTSLLLMENHWNSQWISSNTSSTFTKKIMKKYGC